MRRARAMCRWRFKTLHERTRARNITRAFCVRWIEIPTKYVVVSGVLFGVIAVLQAP